MLVYLGAGRKQLTCSKCSKCCRSHSLSAQTAHCAVQEGGARIFGSWQGSVPVLAGLKGHVVAQQGGPGRRQSCRGGFQYQHILCVYACDST